MIKALTYIALGIAIAAGAALLYRIQPYSISIERAGEVKKKQTSVVPMPVAPSPTPVPFGPVPNVLSPHPTATVPSASSVPAAEPTPAPVIKKRKVKPTKKKSVAQSQLKSKWVAPEAKPFSLGDLFNVK
jgi:hypothetical protein